jgi:hypothetical protein
MTDPRSLDPTTFCIHCRRSGGSFWRVTYIGAPEGGVPVHVKCANEFFAAIDARSPFDYSEPHQ